MREMDVLRDVLRACCRGVTRLFRNNVGQAWTGDWSRLPDGSILIRNPRPLHSGLCQGSSDLIGWTTVEHAGRRFAVFTAIEVKAVRGRIADSQKNFLRVVQEAGGIAGVARSAAEAEALLTNEKR